MIDPGGWWVPVGDTLHWVDLNVRPEPDHNGSAACGAAFRIAEDGRCYTHPFSAGHTICSACTHARQRVASELAPGEHVADDAVKHDDGKPACDLLPPAALLRVSEVLGFGARKYAPHAWRRVPNGHARYLAAGLRHILARMRGERDDPESGLPHLAHAACCLLFCVELDDDTEEP